MKVLGLIAIGAAVAAVPAGAANLIVNGSFEMPGGTVRDQLTPSYVPGWAFSDNGAGYDIYEDDSQDGLTAADGNHYISFGHNGTFGGSVAQVFNLAAGTYTLRYSVAEQQGDDPAQAMEAILGGPGVFYDQTSTALTAMFAAATPFVFTTPGGSFTIEFRDATPEGFGGASNLALDAVSITAFAAGVPEPASWALLLGGFGLVGMALRRRQAVAV